MTHGSALGDPLANGQSDFMDNDMHPLDEPLGDIHEIALLLQFLSGNTPDPILCEYFHHLAKRLATAHEGVQEWALSLEDK